jgi:hypothetical protein
MFYAAPAPWHGIQEPAVEGEIQANHLGGTIMTRTLIAVFDNRGDAQSALDELVSSGFSRSQIRLSESTPTAAPTATETTHGTGFVDSIRHFLGSMFGTDDSEYVQKYSDAVTRGHQVLTLTIDTEREAERAADIVERFGPVDIDEKSNEWTGGALASEAMRMGSGAQQQSSQISQQSSQTAQGTMQGSVQSGQGAMQGSPLQGSQQYAQGMDSGAGISSRQRPGVRVFEHMVEPPLVRTEVDEEIYFRNHYNSNYAGGDERYEDYAPAYQYGAKMATDEAYSGKPWKDIEPQLRSDWEGTNPNSAWNKIKAAVRHGWERITH